MKRRNRKYKCTDERIEFDGHILYRIKALKDFADVKKGELGGFIESHSNLSHKGTCWIYHNAKVFKDSIVMDKSAVSGNSVVKDSLVKDNAFIDDRAIITSGSTIGYGAYIENSAVVSDSVVYNARISENSKVICTHLSSYVNVRGDSVIKGMASYIIIKNWWSSGRNILWTRSNNMWSIGCFFGTSEDLLKKARRPEQYEGYKQIIDFVETKVLKKKKSWRDLIRSFMTQIKENL